MTPGQKIALGAGGAIALLLLLTGSSKADTPPPPPPPPPAPPAPPPAPEVPPLPPLPKPPTLIGDKMAITTRETPLLTQPGGPTRVTARPIPSNVVLKVHSIGYTFPQQGQGEWSKVVVHAGTAAVIFDDKDADTEGFVPSDALTPPGMWTPATF